MLVACGFLFGAACTGGSDPSGNGDDTPAAPEPATLCVASACGEKTVLLTVPDAENLLFSSDGRLFVSGGTNVYEVHRDGADGYAMTPLYDGSCNFTGLAIVRGTLYANCFDGNLYAASLTAQPALRPIHALGLKAPNGLAPGPDGELYIVNGPLAVLPDPKIVRLKLDPADSLKVTEQVDWFHAGLLAPNGLQRHGRTIYVSNTGLGGLGEIRAVPIEDDGSAGTATQFASFLSVPDDFSFVGDSVLAAFFGTGQIALLGADGKLVAQTALLSFSFPSQVRYGQAPLFAPEDLLVTEKGLLFDNNSPIGNRLSVFRRKTP
ncbi:MAG: hypothetical protein ACREVL_18010 [Solimonas sp.]